MSITFASPAPVLVIDDRTHRWVMTDSIVSVTSCVLAPGSLDPGSRIELKTGAIITSHLSPKELYDRLFELDDLEEDAPE